MRIATKFNLDRLKGVQGESIKSVELSLHKMPSYGNYGSELKYKKDADYFIHTALSPWEESWTKEESCWEMEQAPNVALSDPLDTIRYKTNDLGWFTYDVTSAIKQILNGEIDNNGFVMSCKVPGQLQLSGNQAGFYASEYAVDESLRPKLVIIYDNKVDVIKKVTSKSTLYFDSADRCQITIRDISGRILSNYENIAFEKVDQIVGSSNMIRLVTITNAQGFSISQKRYK